MTDIIPFPPRDEDDGDGAKAASSHGAGGGEAVPHDLIAAAADILNDVLARRAGGALSEEDWEKIMRAVNFIQGANTIAREQGLPHGRKQR